VGDPDQTIYSWRGAKVKYILDFDKLYPTAKTIIMDMNYRSLPEIIKTSNSLIKKNINRIEKDLIPVRTENGNSVYFHAKTQEEEAMWIAGQIKSLKEHGMAFFNIAILYRAHYISRVIEEVLVRNQIPYILYSGTAFYRRKEIKDILCYFRMIAHGDDMAFLRVINEPKRGIGKKRVELLKTYSETNNCSLYKALNDNINH
jgi:DNA helicase-2/ATP-dependent DNA helicase PcrA